MNKRSFGIVFGSIGALLLVGAISAFITTKIIMSSRGEANVHTFPVANIPTNFTSYNQSGAPVDFTYAAEQTTHAVVHVKTTYRSNRQIGRQQPSIWDFFFGDPYEYNQRGGGREMPVQQGAGSGVIITPDGYIVTNNHVIDKASEVEVALNNGQTYKATVVGTDPSTDIALLKVEAAGLDFLSFGDSDNLKVGEWVLAVGNPFNLTSTVTAGIVSAKGRNLGIIPGEMRIESFIQTDAAVNPGNSGGALVNTRGELVGINTAIASQTGSFAGYSFAVPAAIAKKVVEDLIQHGVVQRALLGIRMLDLNAETAKEFKVDTKDYKGAYVAEVVAGGAALDAGIKVGDVITRINGTEVKNMAELQEQVSRYRPSDKIDVTVLRNGTEKQIKVTLRNQAGNTDIVKSNDDVLGLLGATFKEVSDKEKVSLGIRNGVQIAEIKKGKLQDRGVKKGFIIVRVNKRPVESVDALKDILQNTSGGVLLEGVYPNGEVDIYAINL